MWRLCVPYIGGLYIGSDNSLKEPDSDANIFNLQYTTTDPSAGYYNELKEVRVSSVETRALKFQVAQCLQRWDHYNSEDQCKTRTRQLYNFYGNLYDCLGTYDNGIAFDPSENKGRCTNCRLV